MIREILIVKGKVLKIKHHNHHTIGELLSEYTRENSERKHLKITLENEAWYVTYQLFGLWYTIIIDSGKGGE